jgi:flagellin
MGLRIATNIQSITAQRNLSGASEANQQSMERLSSGYRINRAADDAAGLGMSEKFRADIKGLGVAKRNANDGISLIQTAEGGLNEVGNILSRLRELAVQSSSDTIGETERGFLNKEFTQLREEVTRIAESTEYNGIKLVNGAGGDEKKLDVQVGKNFAKDVDNGDAPVNVVKLDFTKINASVGEEGLGIGGDDVGVDKKSNAQNSISVIDSAIEKVSGHRATLGSLQNRLGSTINNLAIAIENTAASNSRIRDTDFADETAKMTQSSILKQAGVSVLTQANSVPSLAIRLLG